MIIKKISIFNWQYYLILSLAGLFIITIITMFMSPIVTEELTKELSDFKPLWNPEDIKYFDQNKDGDDFDNQNYRTTFQTILNAINNKKFIHLIHGGENNSDNFTPTHLEYSQKDNVFRLFVNEHKYPINLKKIKSALQFYIVQGQILIGFAVICLPVCIRCIHRKS
jgi:hypothetical protein